MNVALTGSLTAVYSQSLVKPSKPGSEAEKAMTDAAAPTPASLTDMVTLSDAALTDIIETGGPLMRPDAFTDLAGDDAIKAAPEDSKPDTFVEAAADRRAIRSRALSNEISNRSFDLPTYGDASVELSDWLTRMRERNGVFRKGDEQGSIDSTIGEGAPSLDESLIGRIKDMREAKAKAAALDRLAGEDVSVAVREKLAAGIVQFLKAASDAPNFHGAHQPHALSWLYGGRVNVTA